MREGRQLVCYVIAEKCWGNIRNMPQDLKDHEEWPKVIDSIRKGASEYTNEAYRTYYLDKISKGAAGREVNKAIPEDLQRRIEEYLYSDPKGVGDIKSKFIQGLENIRNNTMASRKVNKEYGFFLWSGSKSERDD